MAKQWREERLGAQAWGRPSGVTVVEGAVRGWRWTNRGGAERVARAVCRTVGGAQADRRDAEAAGGGVVRGFRADAQKGTGTTNLQEAEPDSWKECLRVSGGGGALFRIEMSMKDGFHPLQT